jgi:hypothetical protein
LPHRETDAAGEIMMPVPALEAAQSIQIAVLRQMGDNLAAQTRAMSAARSTMCASG